MKLAYALRAAQPAEASIPAAAGMKPSKCRLVWTIYNQLWASAELLLNFFCRELFLHSFNHGLDLSGGLNHQLDVIKAYRVSVHAGANVMCAPMQCPDTHTHTTRDTEPYYHLHQYIPAPTHTYSIGLK